ncbi:hypothetical protein D3C81_1281100 [compost metagenome]
MHRAALALADAGLLAVDLGHHPVHIDALGDAMAVAAVVGGNAVLVVQMGHHPGGAGFLAGIEVDEAGNFAGGELHMQALLEGADGAHDPVGMEELFGIQRSGHLVVLQGLSQRAASVGAVDRNGATPVPARLEIRAKRRTRAAGR